LSEKVAISWSGGKDCCLALHKIIKSQQFSIDTLHTTFNQETRRVGLHGIHEKLIEAQAQSIGLFLEKIFIPSSQDNAAYEGAMREYYQSLVERGIKKIVFGDIFLEELKAYRENILASFGLEGIFPLWKSNSRLLAEEFIKSGFKALICAADSKYFDKNNVGSDYNLNFINSLHPEVDPCGENGEFHTFVYNGPNFSQPIMVHRLQVESKEYTYKLTLPNGQVESRESTFWFQELDLLN
jgi:uncharacterized protein (TIGR00290 family)